MSEAHNSVYPQKRACYLNQLANDHSHNRHTSPGKHVAHQRASLQVRRGVRCPLVSWSVYTIGYAPDPTSAAMRRPDPTTDDCHERQRQRPTTHDMYKTHLKCIRTSRFSHDFAALRRQSRRPFTHAPCLLISNIYTITVKVRGWTPAAPKAVFTTCPNPYQSSST